MTTIPSPNQSLEVRSQTMQTITVYCVCTLLSMVPLQETIMRGLKKHTNDRGMERKKAHLSTQQPAQVLGVSASEIKIVIELT